MKAILVISIVLLIGMIGTVVMYFKFGWLKFFYHDVMGWHIPIEEVGFDGCSFISKCKFCGKKIMQDSQGNWF